MTDPVTYTYVPPQDVTGRAAELERRIGREWLRYALVEAGVIFVPFFAFMLVYILADLPLAALVAAVVVAAIAMTALVLYFLFARIQPLRRELERVRSLEEASR
jgi:hypothetical protein